MENNKLHATGAGAVKPICQCPTITRLCNHAKEKVNGYYCELELAPTEEVKAEQLRSGDKFSFKETPWIVHSVVGNFGDYVRYQKECGWLANIDDTNRLVNRLVTKTETNKN